MTEYECNFSLNNPISINYFEDFAFKNMNKICTSLFIVVLFIIAKY